MRAFAADDGELLHVAVSGDGPPVVLLHGWTASHAAWDPVVPALARHHRLYRWDARGHGLHGLATPAVPTVQRMARDVANLLDHFRLERAALVGHSMGALTAWEYVATFGTARLSALCLVDQSPRPVTDAGWAHGIYGGFDEARAAAFLREAQADFPEAVLRLAAHGLNAAARRRYEAGTPGWRQAREALRRLDPAPLLATWRTLMALDHRPTLARIDVPTLLVHGAESNFYTAEAARYVRDAIPGATLLTYEGADHSPQLAQPERFARDLAGFLAGAAPTRADA